MLQQYFAKREGAGQLAMTTQVAALRQMLWQMEVEIGLQDLSCAQKDLYYAACLTADEQKLIHSDEVRRHDLLSQMPRPTFYRALKDLVAKGLLSRAGDTRDGKYYVKA